MNRCKSYPSHSPVLCPVCLRKLQSVIGFSVKEMFSHMLEVCRELKFEDSAAYYERMLKL